MAWAGAQGAAQVARKVLQTDGVLGLYRGFGMTIVGVIPVRAVGPTALILKVDEA